MSATSWTSSRRVLGYLVTFGMLVAANMPSAAAGSSAAETEVVQFEATAADGTVLRGDIHKPAGATDVATILILSPYWNSAAYGQSENLGARYQFMLDAGFARAAVNLRGTGESGGCFQWGSRLDWSDAYTIVEAIADQPWSNGKVGMYGISYDGWTPYMGVASGAPSLKAAIPMSGVIDLWSLFTARGAPEADVAPYPAGWRAAFSIGAHDPEAVEHASCPDEIAADNKAANDLYETGDRTDYFQKRDLRPFLVGTDVPLLVTSGVRHLGDTWHNRQYQGLFRRLDPDRTRFMVGQWGHSWPSAGREDWPDIVVGWFHHYLRGGPQVVEPGVFEYQDDSGKWHSDKIWPPRPIQRKRLFLSDGDLVARRAKVKRSQAVVQSADGDPGDGCGSHHRLYVSRPVRNPVVLAGNFRFSASIRSTMAGGNFAAVLYKTPGDGSCGDVTAQGVEVGRTQLDLRHWKTPGESRDFPVNELTTLWLRSEPIMSRVPKGQRLVLAIGGGSAQLAPDQHHPQLTIATGRRMPGGISLPVINHRMRLGRF